MYDVCNAVTHPYAAGFGQVYLRRECVCFLHARLSVRLREQLRVEELLQVRSKHSQVTRVIDASAVDGVFQKAVNVFPLAHLTT